MPLCNCRIAAAMFVTALLLLDGSTVTAQGQNSTRKIRVKPGPLAAKIGQGIEWQDDLLAALKQSAESGKPVFWYVPTLSNSFMDRRDSIDRYMLAGPFSWESTRKLLGEKYVCVRAVPDRKLAEKFELMPYKFVEPGFLILDGKGTVSRKVDRITTMHPDWINHLLDETFVPASINDYWKQFSKGDFAIEIPESATAGDSTEAIQNGLLRGMVAFRNGKHDAAKQIWKELAARHPNHPLAWKAAAESQGFGPFVRGFEIHQQLPVAAMDAGIRTAGSNAGNRVYDESELWKRSVAFLLGMQREDGAWVDSDYDFGGTDSLPNVHVAVTSLAAMALLDAQKKVPDRAADIRLAVARATQFVTDPKNINPVDRDELLWALAYQTRLLARQVINRPELKDALQTAVTKLENIQTKRGNWYHEYSNSFVAATALCALKEAQTAGAVINDEKVTKGWKALARDRFGNGAYPYSSRRGEGQAAAGTERQIVAAAGRMPICELGISYWKTSDIPAQAARLQAAVEQAFDLHSNLDMALKYDDHTSNLSYGGFFFWYDMRGRSEAISHIKDATLRKQFEARQKKLILELPEIDGCFVDSHELGRCYGTAMALLCLGMME